MKKLFSTLFIFVALFTTFASSPVSAQTETEPAVEYDDAQPTVYVFGRDDCGVCKAQFTWMQEENIPFEYMNIITDDNARSLYDEVTAKHGITKITPITVVGERVFGGYNGAETTGKNIIMAMESGRSSAIKTLEDHLLYSSKQDAFMGGGCTELSCSTGIQDEYLFTLPILGTIDLKLFSLFSLSVILGVIDGFNPCAMWVLITFLVILSQAGSKKKMIFLAGIFILAQGIMYNLILNVWYKTWDFVALDQYVTPFVGFLALGGGFFFLYRWHKNKDAQLVCDITDIESQSKTIDKIKTIVNQPVTIASIFAILVIAFSINIIEFACSIGIPQAYTKILEINMLTFMERQWYILVYTLAYMFDDLIVFALAIWGYSKLQSHGGKYAQLSLLIGGALMLLLGVILVLNPNLLVF